MQNSSKKHQIHELKHAMKTSVHNMPSLFSDEESVSNAVFNDEQLHYIPNFFSEHDSQSFFEILKSTVLWKHESITLFGKKVLQPRLTALYGNINTPYRYSGLTMFPNQWTKELLIIKTMVENSAQHVFNTVLLNFYRSGNDSMGWHSDNEAELGKNPIIASVTFGVERRFVLRLNNNHSQKHIINLSSGSLLIMKGNLQHISQHSLPKQKDSIGERINLTFRHIK